MDCTLQVLEPVDDTYATVGEHRVLVTPQLVTPLYGSPKHQFIVSTPITLFADAGQTVEYGCTYSFQTGYVQLQAGISGFLTEN